MTEPPDPDRAAAARRDAHARPTAASSPAPSGQKSVWKLDRVLRSHPQLLLALARFLLAGNEIYILRGNHDVEMYWPQVQEHFRLVLAQHHPADTSYLEMKAAIEARLHFLPWFYLDQGLLYVEHGCQYDPFCANEHNLCPVLPDRPEQIHLPFSAFSMRYFAARIAMVDPAAIENVNSIPRYLGRLLARNPLLAFRLPYYYVEMIARTLSKVNRPLARRRARDRRPRGRGPARAGEDVRGCRPPRWRASRVCASAPSSAACAAPSRASRSTSIAAGVLLDGRPVAGARRGTAAAGWPPARCRRRWWPGSAPAGSSGPRRSTITATCARSRGRSPTAWEFATSCSVTRTSPTRIGCRTEDDRWYFNVGTWVPNLQEGQFIYLQVLRDDGGSARADCAGTAGGSGRRSWIRRASAAERGRARG